MLPRFEEVHRTRPVSLVADEREDGFLAPWCAVEVALGTHDVAGRVVAGFTAGGQRWEGWYDGGRRLAGLSVTDDRGRVRHHRSRRHGRPTTPPDAVAATLTGSQLTVLTRSGGTWTARARVDVGHELDPAGLACTSGWRPRLAGDPSPVAGRRSGTFGQLGLRDIHLVTHADGTPVERGGLVFLSATQAGPGFFDTAHAGVWSLDRSTYALRHCADLWFRRDGRHGRRVYGDHATHLVRHEGRWLVAASTWGDFDRTGMQVTLAESSADLLTGEHVLDTRPLPLPLDQLPGGRVGAWDPHLALVDGHWHLAFVAARRFFDFHPVLVRAAAPGRLDGWELLGAAEDRTATEGTVLARLDDTWRLLASDGRKNPAPVGGRFPVFDLAVREVGTLDAPYPTNLPWPTLVPHEADWLLVTFDGTRHGGPVTGYGTHGDVVVLRTTVPQEEP